MLRDEEGEVIFTNSWGVFGVKNSFLKINLNPMPFLPTAQHSGVNGFGVHVSYCALRTSALPSFVVHFV